MRDFVASPTILPNHSFLAYLYPEKSGREPETLLGPATCFDEADSPSPPHHF